MAKDKYISVTSTNSTSPAERMRVLAERMSRAAEEGYRPVCSPVDLHMYGDRWQTGVIMELTPYEEYFDMKGTRENEL